MAHFRKLPEELQMKIRTMEYNANNIGRYEPETKELWNELGKLNDICGSLSQSNGQYKACLREPHEHSKENHEKPRCSIHGGKADKGISEESKLKKMENLRPDANMITGMYGSEEHFINSLTDEELHFMVWLEEQVRSKYEVEEGLGDIVLEGVIQDAVLHFRMLNKGKLEKGSKHTAKPLQDALKTIKDMGWTPREQKRDTSQSVLDKYISEIDRVVDSQEENNEGNSNDEDNIH